MKRFKGSHCSLLQTSYLSQPFENCQQDNNTPIVQIMFLLKSFRLQGTRRYWIQDFPCYDTFIVGCNYCYSHYSESTYFLGHFQALLIKEYSGEGDGPPSLSGQLGPSLSRHGHILPEFGSGRPRWAGRLSLGGRASPARSVLVGK